MYQLLSEKASHGRSWCSVIYRCYELSTMKGDNLAAAAKRPSSSSTTPIYALVRTDQMYGEPGTTMLVLINRYGQCISVNVYHDLYDPCLSDLYPLQVDYIQEDPRIGRWVQFLPVQKVHLKCLKNVLNKGQPARLIATYVMDLMSKWKGYPIYFM